MVPGPRGQYSGTIRFIEKNGVQDEAKRSSEHRVAYPEVKDLVRIVGSVAPLPNGGLIPRENSFYRATGGKRAKRHGTARKSSGTGPCGDCRTFLWIPGPRGQ